MIERRQSLRLALEPREPIGIVREHFGQDLQRDVPPELGIPGAIDLAHTTRAKGGRNLIGPYAGSRSEPHVGPGILSDRLVWIELPAEAGSHEMVLCGHRRGRGFRLQAEDCDRRSGGVSRLAAPSTD